MDDQDKQERWATRIGVILAVSGSAVGLGNFLRFPGQAAQNGGGAFLLPYFCALLFLGIPIGWAEWTMGRYGGLKGLHSAPAILGVFGRGAIARYLGALGVLIPLAVSFFYTFVEAWCLGYFWTYLNGGLGVDTTASIAEQTRVSSEFYRRFSGNEASGILFSGAEPTVLFWVITFAVNLYFVYRGLSKGIETFCRWAMPAMALCALVVLIRVLTLGTPDPARPELSVSNGLGYMWNPDFGALGNPQTWLAAAGQIFFSLSVGFGVIINYASYLRHKDDVVLSSLTASATNELFEVGFGGLITLTASFVFLGLSGTTAAIATGTYALGFTTLPVVFAQMGPLGNTVGAVWFLMLFLAAITSSLSMYQPTVAFFQESLGITRKAAVALLAITCIGGSLPVLYFSEGGVFRTTIDDWVGTFCIFVLAAVQIICFSWVFGADRGLEEAHRGASIRIPRAQRFVMKYVAPTYLILVFVAFCSANLGHWIYDAVSSPLRQGALVLVGLVLVFLLVCVRIGEKRWRAAGLDIDGRLPLGSESRRKL
ncbi:MAG TPA: sodium:calcium symporter [Vicinamibacteria bacterium]|nr:sodium:calcium symporter [Vicinamibacteria bacterium]